MGSLSSTPKIPQQQVVYMPAPSPSPSQPKAISSAIAAQADSSAKNAAGDREKTLLARKRGRLGTIATSLRGFLGEVNSNKRKTLLGE